MSQVPSKANAALAPTSAYIGSAVKSTATSLNLNPTRSVPKVVSPDDKRKWEDFVGELEKSWKSAEAKRKAEKEAAKAAPKPDEGNAWMKAAHEKTVSVLRAIGLKKSPPTPPATLPPSPPSQHSVGQLPTAGSSARTSSSPQKP